MGIKAELQLNSVVIQQEPSSKLATGYS